MIYLDNAATSLWRPDCVLDAVSEAMITLGNPGRGAHKPSLDAARTIYNARISAAKLFGNVSPSSIAFTSNATESLNAAIFGLLSSNCGIITTMTEHNSVLRPLYLMRDMGAEISFIPSYEDGTINISCADELVTGKTRAVILNHISNVTGEIADLEFFSEFCKRHNLLLILDCAQSAGHIPIDINDYNIDVCCFTGHKGLLGPQGTGGIYIRPGLEIRPFKSGGSGSHSFDEYQPSQMPDVLEAGTSNTHGIAGLKAGIDYLIDYGIHNVYNALAAICVGLHFGLTASECAAGLKNCVYTSSRLEIINHNGIEIINDCYNSSPDSVRAALDVQKQSVKERRVAILGDILEMGDFAKNAHYDLGCYAAGCGLDMLITVGENAKNIAQGAIDNGMKNVKSFNSTDEVTEEIQRLVHDGDSVLVKASHGMNFYKITEAIKEI